jgi:GT2 family glycosyltransferase
MAIRRDAWTQVGPLDESFAFYGQDLDFCDRLRRAGWHVRLVPGWRVMHVGGATIGRAPGSMGGVRNPSLLWSDLLLWASRAYGTSWTARTARLMSAAASGRIAARWLLRPLAASREEWDRDTASLRLARAAARAWSGGDPPRLS